MDALLLHIHIPLPLCLDIQLLLKTPEVLTALGLPSCPVILLELTVVVLVGACALRPYHFPCLASGPGASDFFNLVKPKENLDSSFRLASPG